MKKKGAMINMGLKVVIGMIIASFFLFFFWTLIQGSIVFSSVDADRNDVIHLSNKMEDLCSQVSSKVKYVPGRTSRVKANHTFSSQLRELEFLERELEDKETVTYMKANWRDDQKFNMTVKECDKWDVELENDKIASIGKVGQGTHEFRMRAIYKNGKKVMDVEVLLY